MWFNSTVSEEPYQGLTSCCKRTETCDLRGCRTGAAWLSSARVVKCSVQSGNERNPCEMLFVSFRTAPVNGEEGGDDVKSAWPLYPGPHTCYSGRHNGLPRSNPELIPKTGLGLDWGLKPAPMKTESLVIVGQLYHGEYVLESCTHNKSARRCIFLSG